MFTKLSKHSNSDSEHKDNFKSSPFHGNIQFWDDSEKKISEKKDLKSSKTPTDDYDEDFEEDYVEDFESESKYIPIHC